MKLNLLAPLLFVPSLVYFAVHLARKQPRRETVRELGWALLAWSNWGEAVLVLLALTGLAAVAFHLIPPGALQGDEMNTALYAGWTRSAGSLALIFLLELFNRALPEEVFFRGWLGGRLFSGSRVLLMTFTYAGKDRECWLSGMLPHGGHSSIISTTSHWKTSWNLSLNGVKAGNISCRDSRDLLLSQICPHYPCNRI